MARQDRGAANGREQIPAAPQCCCPCGAGATNSLILLCHGIDELLVGELMTAAFVRSEPGTDAVYEQAGEAFQHGCLGVAIYAARLFGVD